MKNPRRIWCISAVGSCLLAFAASGQTMIENFEYADDAEMQTVWLTPSTTSTLSQNVAADATGTNSLQINISFLAAPWDTRILTQMPLPNPVAIKTNQYVTIRLTGDRQFTNATFRSLFIYAYDSAGNFGRWGATIPLAPDWTAFNFLASAIEKPWDSTALPDLNDIVQFKLVIYGQGDPAGSAYDATIFVDDLQIRDTELLPPPPANKEFVIADFESYANDTALLADWDPDVSTLGLSANVSGNSTGTNSLRIERTFRSLPWEAEVIKGPELAAPVAVKPSQWITFRVAGDPQLTNATYQTLFVYAYDASGNFGRWGAVVPTTSKWGIVNLLASSIGKPWDSPALPNLNNLVRVSFVLYGQGDPAGPEYTANVYVDDLMVRDSSLAEFDPPSAMRTMIENFESYADETALLGFYSYVNSPATTVTTASLNSPAPQGSKALKLAIDFSNGRYPWGSVMSTAVEPFSIPTNATVQFRFKGDATLAPVNDAASTFWLSFYDTSGTPIHYSGQIITNSDWVVVNANMSDFWSDAAVDTGNLVKWRILVQGWDGTTETPALHGDFYVDDIKVTVPPTVAVTRNGSTLTLQMGNLMSGTTYTVRQTTDFVNWTTATTIVATGKTATWAIPAGQKGFYQVYYAP